MPQPTGDPESPVRKAILDVLEFFVTRARDIEGLQRIALLGSITTPKHEPKDLDLLVEIDSHVPLRYLARLGRQARGRLQSCKNRGCDVFLASADVGYLGRLCIWTRCGPGIRTRCDAQHCGQREFLHDDFDDIRLSDELIREPPVELWPRLLVRRSVPPDLQARLDRLTRLANQ